MIGCLYRIQNSSSAIINNINATSVAPLLGPGSVVADSSALEGTTLDNVCTTTDSESVFKVIVPLVGDKIACLVCEKKKAHFFFLNLTDVDKYLKEHHLVTTIEWECVTCGKQFPKLHGARCHISWRRRKVVKVYLNVMLPP